MVFIYILKLKERLDGNVWELPAAVYGRTVNLEPGMNYSQKEMVSLLEGMQYRHVNKNHPSWGICGQLKMAL